MRYASCPSAVIDAPVDLVWELLTTPAAWEDFFDIKIAKVDPPGPAVIGQKITGESGPRFLHLRLALQFTEINPADCRLGLNVRLPFGITIREDLHCVALESNRCRVAYGCAFDLPAGWRGVIARVGMRRKLDTGPADSLSRLKRAAEGLHADRKA